MDKQIEQKEKYIIELMDCASDSQGLEDYDNHRIDLQEYKALIREEVIDECKAELATPKEPNSQTDAVIDYCWGALEDLKK